MDTDVSMRAPRPFAALLFTYADRLVTIDNNQLESVRECENRIGYAFQRPELLLQGLTHSSSAATRLDCNERMEFLGDAVLGMAICEELYERYPEKREGELTQQKSHLVSRAVCVEVAERLKLGDLMFVGKGLQTIPQSILAAVVESIIAAIFIDGGYAEAKGFILRAFDIELSDNGRVDSDNYKSQLQEITQRDGSPPPTYELIEQRGPDHAREFLIAVEIGKKRFESAWGKSKKEAEQKAAKFALRSLDDA